MRKFELTDHSYLRMLERKIPHPNKRRLRPVGRKEKAKIREKCQLNGVKNNWGSKYIYYTDNTNVYVCITLDINHYLLITAFKI